MHFLSESNLQELFCKISEGNTGAFRQLFDRYNTRLYAAALKLTKSPTSAEDIVQEVFTALWVSREKLADIDHPSTYLFTVAYNQSYRYLKRVAADGRLYQSLLNRMKASSPAAEQWLEVEETQACINDAVNALPSQRQLIYRLSREKGLSHQEIADQLKISPLTVKKQIVLALRHIRASLAQFHAIFLTLLL